IRAQPARDPQLDTRSFLRLDLRRLARLLLQHAIHVGNVDLLRLDGARRQYGDDVVAHLGEAAIDEESLDIVAVPRPQLAGTETADEGRPSRQDTEFAVVHRHRDEVDGGVEDGALRRDDDTLQRGAARRGGYHWRVSLKQGRRLRRSAWFALRRKRRLGY